MTTPIARRGRPPVSSREAVEEIAFSLLLRDGYEATTVHSIMAASGVGRSTFFRYFGSKGGIVWIEFDRAIERLRQQLDHSDAPVMDAIIDAVTEATRLSRDAAPDTWLDRFRVLDHDPALSAETARHWRDWASTLSRFVEMRLRLGPDSLAAAAVGGAIQAAYVAMLRRWASQADDGPTAEGVDLESLRDELAPLGDALQRFLTPGR